jgi:hypothetical protein
MKREVPNMKYMYMSQATLILFIVFLFVIKEKEIATLKEALIKADAHINSLETVTHVSNSQDIYYILGSFLILGVVLIVIYGQGGNPGTEESFKLPLELPLELHKLDDIIDCISTNNIEWCEDRHASDIDFDILSQIFYN